MSNEIVAALVGLLAGLIGSGGIFGGILFHRLRRLELAYEARVTSLIEQKIRVYRKAASFLRRIKSFRIGEAFDIWNDIADELMLWGSEDVYKRASRFLRKMAADPGLSGLVWEEEIGPILQAMVKDTNPGTGLATGDILEFVQFLATDEEISHIHSYAYSNPERFDEILTALARNQAHLTDVSNYKVGDPKEVLHAIRSNIDDMPPKGAA